MTTVAPSRIASIAMVAHEVNRAYCLAIGDCMDMPHWRDSPQWQRDSCIAGVKAHLSDPDMTPADSHESWIKGKIDAGWVLGHKKDLSAKTHPCLVRFDKLPREQQVKDHLFSAVVRALSRGEIGLDAYDDREDRPMTSGEYKVGIDFNPGGSGMVNALKRASADFIDLVDRISVPAPTGAVEVGRLKALANTAIEQAAMWAVKAATKKPPS